MSARLQSLPAAPPPETGPVYMDAVLVPSRSLSAKGLQIVMVAMAAASFVAGLVFLAMGAWPVVGFFGLDVLLLWLAFRSSFAAAARQREAVRVTAERITVSQREARGPERHWSASTHFARVHVEQPDEWETHVALGVGTERLSLARCLSPHERLDFAGALRHAIERARRERHPAEAG